MAINIYQVFTRLFRNPNTTNKQFGTLSENGCSKFNHFTPAALSALRTFGVTHIWYTGIIRHASCTAYPEHGIEADNPRIVKGIAGSPYAIKDYFDVAPDLAEDVPNRMGEFEALVMRTHKAGLKVIIDYIPNHVARAYRSDCRPEGIQDLGQNDNTQLAFDPNNNYYYIPNQAFIPPDGINFPYTQGAEKYHEMPAKVTGNNAFTHKPGVSDWYETVKLNLGVNFQGDMSNHFDKKPNTWKRMREILEFWASKGVDGFRCDMAEMVPVEFWQWVIPKIKSKFEHVIFIAEIYNPNEYRKFLFQGEFDYLYDKVGLYDTLRDIVDGKAQAWQITNCWKAQEGFSQRMLRFMENHDEQRIASTKFAGSAFAGFPAMIVAGTMHTGPLMIYFGQEIGETGADAEGYSSSDGRTTIFDYWCVKEYQKWVSNGKFDGTDLSNEQQQIRAFYSKLLSIRLNSEAISEGNFYDLMWSNQSDSLFSQKHYAYLRHTPSQILLVVLNFDTNHDKTLTLKLPEHALDLTRLSEKPTVTGKDLLELHPDISFSPSDAPTEGIQISLKRCSGVIFELTI